jgi:murein DD-endopeptidase MepM/ murein hydrolase activator NlpD
MHRGQDIAAPRGTPIYAAQSGTVVYAQRRAGYGNLILIDHHNGIITAYAHLNRFRVRVGDVVERRQRIGDMGSTGNSTGSHLHFETRVNGSAVNPRQYLTGSPCG